MPFLKWDMMADFLIRPISFSDLPALAQLESLSFSTPWSKESLQASFEKENCFMIAATVKKTVVGYAALDWVLDEGYIDNICVHPAWKRNHIGSALLSALIAFGKKQKLCFLSLEVRESNVPAISLYCQEDFLLIGRRKNYYQKPREDALILTRFYSEKKDFSHENFSY